MSFVTRAVIAVLTGVGAGIIGFGVVWKSIERFLQDDPSRYDAALLTGIFGPGVLTALIVFATVSRAATRQPA